jgi:hypothetical protein
LDDVDRRIKGLHDIMLTGEYRTPIGMMWTGEYRTPIEMMWTG